MAEERCEESCSAEAGDEDTGSLDVAPVDGSPVEVVDVHGSCDDEQPDQREHEVNESHDLGARGPQRHHCIRASNSPPSALSHVHGDL